MKPWNAILSKPMPCPELSGPDASSIHYEIYTFIVLFSENLYKMIQKRTLTRFKSLEVGNQPSKATAKDTEQQNIQKTDDKSTQNSNIPG